MTCTTLRSGSLSLRVALEASLLMNGEFIIANAAPTLHCKDPASLDECFASTTRVIRRLHPRCGVTFGAERRVWRARRERLVTRWW